MAANLKGLKVAILVADGFEQSELIKPKRGLEAAGAWTTVVSPARKTVQGWNHDEKGDEFPVDVALDEAVADNYDATSCAPFLTPFHLSKHSSMRASLSPRSAMARGR